MFGILGSLEKYPKIVGSWCVFIESPTPPSIGPPQLSEVQTLFVYLVVCRNGKRANVYHALAVDLG